MRLVVSFAIAAGLVGCLAFAVEQQPQQISPALLSPALGTAAKARETSHTLNLNLYEKHGETKKVLANPTILTNDKKQFSFVAGGEILDVSPVLEYGTSVNGTIEQNADGHLQVALRIMNGSPVKLDDPSITAVQSRCIDVRMNVERSTTKTIQIDGHT